MLQGGSVTIARPAWLDEWSRFATDLTFEALPQAVVERGKQVLFDCIGAIAAGAQEPEVVRLTDKMLIRGANGEAPVIGAHRRAAPGAAAFLNGLSGTMLEIDEGNQFPRGHPGIQVLPAALAAAGERRASGRELVVALTLGYEIGSRIGIASKLRVTMHPHGTWGTVGAAVAVARLNGATSAQVLETINVASTLGLATSRRTMLEGGTVRNNFAGFSNEIGLRAWDMVEAGFVGETDGVGTIFGGVVADNFRPDGMVAELGRRWEIARNYFKRHAVPIQSRRDRRSPEPRRWGRQASAETVDRVEVDTYVWAAQLTDRSRNMLAANSRCPSRSRQPSSTAPRRSRPFAIPPARTRSPTCAARDGERSSRADVHAAGPEVHARDDPSQGRPQAEGGGAHQQGRRRDPYSDAEICEKFHEIKIRCGTQRAAPRSFRVSTLSIAPKVCRRSRSSWRAEDEIAEMPMTKETCLAIAEGTALPREIASLPASTMASPPRSRPTRALPRSMSQARASPTRGSDVPTSAS